MIMHWFRLPHLRRRLGHRSRCQGSSAHRTLCFELLESRDVPSAVREPSHVPVSPGIFSAAWSSVTAGWNPGDVVRQLEREAESDGDRHPSFFLTTTPLAGLRAELLEHGERFLELDSSSQFREALGMAWPRLVGQAGTAFALDADAPSRALVERLANPLPEQGRLRPQIAPSVSAPQQVSALVPAFPVALAETVRAAFASQSNANPLPTLSGTGDPEVVRTTLRYVALVPTEVAPATAAKDVAAGLSSASCVAEAIVPVPVLSQCEPPQDTMLTAQALGPGAFGTLRAMIASSLLATAAFSMAGIEMVRSRRRHDCDQCAAAEVPDIAGPGLLI
jgi:hypothetical protein